MCQMCIRDRTKANPSQRGATITENAGASYAAQQLTPDKAKEYIQSVVFSAPLLLRQQSDKFILVTQSVYDEMCIRDRPMTSWPLLDSKAWGT